jgi:hypothetical protein
MSLTLSIVLLAVAYAARAKAAASMNAPLNAAEPLN